MCDRCTGVLATVMLEKTFKLCFEESMKVHPEEI